MTTQTHPAVAEYLARTQAALAGLPASEVEEILEDIGPHLSDVATELGEGVTVDALTERLGTPEQYAAELRAAAGYPPAGPPPPRRWVGTLLARFALWALVINVLVAFVFGLDSVRRPGDTIGLGLLVGLPLVGAVILIFTGRVRPAEVGGLVEARAARRTLDSLPDNVTGYLRSLRPGWWLARIVVLAGTLLSVMNNVKAPFVFWAVLALVVLLWFGPWARTDKRWLWVVAPANAFAAGLGLQLLGLAWMHV